MFKSEKGASMIIALLVILILTLLGSAIWVYSTNDTSMASNQEKQVKAFYLAKSAADAVASYITNPATSKSSVNSLVGRYTNPQSISGMPGTFVVSVSRETNTLDSNYYYITITSNATNGPISAKTTLMLKPSFLKSIVGVASGNNTMFSNTGLANNWIATGGTGTNSMNDVAWNGSSFVTVGDGGYIRTSSDGTNWSNEFRVSYTLTVNTYTNVQRINAIAWTGAFFVAVGDNATIMMSATGENGTWNFVPITVGTNALRSVASNGSRIIAVTDGGLIRTSDNGNNWSAEKLAISTVTSNLKRIYWDGSNFIILGDNKTVLVSPTGADGSWVNYPLTTGTYGLNAISWDLSTGRYVGVGNGGVIRTSSNGITWSAEYTSGVATNLNDVIWVGDAFLAFGDSGRILSSKTISSGSWISIGTNGSFIYKNAAYGGPGAIYLSSNVIGKK